MKKAKKAAMLSGLVFPGFGQIFLKRYVRGILLILSVLAALFMIIGKATLTAHNILQEELHHGMPNYERASELVHKYAYGDNSYYYAGIFVIIACLIYGIVDALCYKDEA